MSQADTPEKKILVELTDIFRTVFEDDSIVLDLHITQDDIPQWDSMAHVTLVVEVEHRFGVKFKTAEVEELRDVGELVALIKARSAVGVD